MSYARIAAIGLSSAVIAELFNDLAAQVLFAVDGPLRAFTFIGWLAISLVGHGLNFALAALGGGIHSLRLHLVEFYLKFYEGGGVDFAPFGSQRIYSEVI